VVSNSDFIQKNSGNTENWIWWKHGIIYHIYVRSFLDSNGDGIGDLQGIIRKLDYLSDLGIDAIWLSPIYKSPNVDYGYDVSDYRKINPEYGTLNDLKQLLDEAHKRGIRLIKDMVMNHTSTEHPWFLESSSSKSNSKRDWYIWKDSKNGKAPNNWKSAFGGSGWEWNKNTQQYYFHSFFKEQADLNWRNTDLQDAFFEEIKFWLDFGIDGFRLDVINFILKDKKFRNNPSLFSIYKKRQCLIKKRQIRGLRSQKKRSLHFVNEHFSDKRNEEVGVFLQTQFKIFNRQSLLFTRNRPASYKIIKKLRDLIDSYPERMIVGEIYTTPPGDTTLVASYLGQGDDLLNLAFNFEPIFKPWNARLYYLAISKWIKSIPKNGWLCFVFSNHDLHRSINRIGTGINKTEKAKVLAALLLTVKGTPFIYYGEEIGLPNYRMEKNAIKDPIGKKFWPIYSGRDSARTPMRWNSYLYAGFSENEPWLPIGPEIENINVKSQKKDKDSIYQVYKKLIEIRKEHKSLQIGSWKPICKGRNGVIAYYRQFEEELTLIILNFTFKIKLFKLPDKYIWELIYTPYKERMHSNKGHVKLGPYEVVIYKKIRKMKSL
jgi:alpha-glucosidase